MPFFVFILISPVIWMSASGIGVLNIKSITVMFISTLPGVLFMIS